MDTELPGGAEMGGSPPPGREPPRELTRPAAGEERMLKGPIIVPNGP